MGSYNASYFADLAARWDPMVLNGAMQVSANVINANQDFLKVLGIIMFVILGMLMSFKALPYYTGMAYIIRLSIVCLLMVSTNYNEYIINPVMVEFPNLIARATNGAGGAAGVTQFDDLSRQINLQKVAILQQAGAWAIADRMVAYILAWCCLALVTVIFALFEFSKTILGFVVAVGPFVIVLALFQTTRQVAHSFGAVLLTLLLAMAMLSISIAFVMSFNQATMIMAGGGIDAMLAQMENFLKGLAFGLMVVFALPVIAMRIGGGVAVATAPVIGGMVTAGMGAVRMAGRGAAGGMRFARGG